MFKQSLYPCDQVIFFRSTGESCWIRESFVIHEMCKRLHVTLYIFVWIQWRKNTRLELVTFNRQRWKSRAHAMAITFCWFLRFLEPANIFLTEVCPTLILTIYNLHPKKKKQKRHARSKTTPQRGVGGSFLSNTLRRKITQLCTTHTSTIYHT